MAADHHRITLSLNQPATSALHRMEQRGFTIRGILGDRFAEDFPDAVNPFEEPLSVVEIDTTWQADPTAPTACCGGCGMSLAEGEPHDCPEYRDA